jgi:hypothetical protein
LAVAEAGQKFDLESTRWLERCARVAPMAGPV